MIIIKMNWFFFFVFHFLFVDVTIAAATAGDKVEVKESTLSSSTAAKATATTFSLSTSSTTALPVKAEEHEEKPVKPEVGVKEGETVEKPLPKKRGILDELYRVHPENFEETEFDGDEEPTPEELFAGSHGEPGERPLFRYNVREDSGALDGDGYFENEGRRKRTAMFDGLYNRFQDHSNPEGGFSPDEVMALLNILGERRFYNVPVQSPWNEYDNNVGSFESDIRDDERERPGNLYAEGYDSNLDSLEKYPVKRYMITRRRRSNFLGNPKLNVPIFRRAIL